MAATLNREEAELDQAIDQLQDTVRADIAEFARSSPSDENGRKLQSKIQRNTTHLRARLRELELLAEEQETIEEGDAVVAVVTQHKRSYEELQRALRNANLEVQRRAAQAAQEQRRALMASGDYMERAEQLKTQQDLTNSAADTTASLQRTRQLMAEELQHTSATLAAMETSETTLKAANKQYKDQRGTIKQSQGLLRTMRVNSLKDSLKLYTALAFFTLVIAYIGFRRMSYFVPPAIINSLPTLKTFGIGQSQVSSGAEIPYLDQQQYEVPGIDSGGGGGRSAASKSSFQTRLAEAQRHAGVALRQAAHHSRRLAVWLFQQSRNVIAGIKQKIEERQGRSKLGQKDLFEGSDEEGGREAWPDPSDPAYEEPPAVYEEPGQPGQQQAEQAAAAGAHPGYAGGLEAMYGGGSMRGSGDSLGANDTMPDSGEGGDVAVNQTVAPEAAGNEQPQRPDQERAAAETSQQATQDPEVLDGAAAREQQNISAAGEGDMGVPHEPKNSTQRLEEAELITGISPDAELVNASTPAAAAISSNYSDPLSAVSAADATPSEDSEIEAAEPVAAESGLSLDSTVTEVEDVAPAAESAGVDRKPLRLEQEETVQQGNSSGIADSTLSDMSEDETVHLPRQGTMPEPLEEVEDSTVTPAADTPLQEDQQAEEGVEGSMQLGSPVEEEEDGSASREAAAAPSRERVPLIGKVLGKMRWPEEGPSRPRGSKWRCRGREGWDPQSGGPQAAARLAA